MRASSVASEGLELLHAVLWSSLDARTEALMTGGRNGNFGCSRGRRRWGVVCVALWAERRVPVDFWRFGECFWKLNWVCGGWRKELASVWIFGQK